MQPSDAPILASLLHLLLVEPLAVFAFYISYLMHNTSLIAWIQLWFVRSSEIESAQGGPFVLGEYVTCTYNDAFGAFYSMNTSFIGTCVDYEGNNYGGHCNYICLLLCLFVWLIQVGSVLREGAWDVTRGGFYACKWRLARTSFYRWSASVLLLGALLTGLVLTLLAEKDEKEYQLSEDQRVGLLVSYLSYQMFPALGVFGSAAAVVWKRKPRFNYNGQKFKAIRFRRSWKSVLTEGSGGFALTLENAILAATVGKRRKLEALLMDSHDVEDIIQICTFTEEAEAGTVKESLLPA